ncbi:iron-sulfur cluster assembly scaffold protein [Candidatus Kuenenbacteria bacterium HGW-Kuenenbacteria-1]|uniref:Iron-sulfur cluster assembly scaffold protein n=1 Tax=Candidatus Kuenenbacteria bacterium HGW-Kuenenbacteria-1 TaxID=2013812 RepID=A0A2N1UMP3_9BACT|nr:MAG: iron-sulfur cluster assembly scaffold protein [Candidatus Kuenenbacteria bacterium HGW-Kuenenbacteria-1]
MIDYNKKVIKYFTHPKNVGEIKNADAIGEAGNFVCGDKLTIYLKINPKSKKINQAKFLSYGCASNIATSSILTEMVKGKTIEQAKKISHQKITKALGGLPSEKIHCSILALDAFKKAIENYKKTL